MKKISVPMNDVFRKVNTSRKRYRVLRGSAGSGKSVNVATDFILKLSDPRYKGANLLVVRKADVTNKHSTYAELKGLFSEYLVTSGKVIGLLNYHL